MLLSERIRAWRESNGLSQSQLARRIGVQPSTVSYWESGTNLPSAKHLEMLAAALGITMRGFYGPIRKRAKGAA